MCTVLLLRDEFFLLTCCTFRIDPIMLKTRLRDGEEGEDFFPAFFFLTRNKFCPLLPGGFLRGTFLFFLGLIFGKFGPFFELIAPFAGFPRFLPDFTFLGGDEVYWAFAQTLSDGSRPILFFFSVPPSSVDRPSAYLDAGSFFSPLDFDGFLFFSLALAFFLTALSAFPLAYFLFLQRTKLQGFLMGSVAFLFTLRIVATFPLDCVLQSFLLRCGQLWFVLVGLGVKFCRGFSSRTSTLPHRPPLFPCSETSFPTSGECCPREMGYGFFFPRVSLRQTLALSESRFVFS